MFAWLNKKITIRLQAFVSLRSRMGQLAYFHARSRTHQLGQDGLDKIKQSSADNCLPTRKYATHRR
jgi:hypothetical protein